MVHGLRDLRDIDQAILSKMEPFLHHAHDLCKPSELLGLRRSQRILFEERNNAATQVIESPDAISVEMLTMIVVSAIDTNTAASEEGLQLVQNLHAPFSLNHSEDWLNLPTQSHRWVSLDRDAEAPFPVYESDYPLLEAWSFLLIVRTRHVFTAFPRANRSRSDE
jgi:hypothetical protein